MTGPFPQLPHVDLGNTASDIGTAGGSLVAGLLKQKNLARQQALSEALGQSKINLEGTQGDVNEANATQEIPAHAGQLTAEATTAIPARAGLDTAEAARATTQTGILAHNALNADPEQHAQLRALSPNYVEDPNMSRSEADERIKELSMSKFMMDRLGLTTQRFDQGKVLDELNKFRADPEVKSAVGSAQVYKNNKLLMARGAPITTPSLLLDLGQTLGMPGQPNARAIGVELSNLLKGSGLTYSQRAQQFMNKLITTGDQFTLDPESQAAIPEIMQGVMKSKMMRYDTLRGDLKNRVSGVLGSNLPDAVVGSDPFADIRDELAQPQQPAVPQPGGQGGSSPAMHL